MDAVDEILALDGRRRVALSEVNDLKAQRNEVSKEIGRIKRDGGDADEMIVEMRVVGDRISEIDEEVGRAEERIRELMLLTPNLPLDEVPSGGVEKNEIVRVSAPVRSSTSIPSHIGTWDLASDFLTSSGARKSPVRASRCSLVWARDSSDVSSTSCSIFIRRVFAKSGGGMGTPRCGSLTW